MVYQNARQSEEIAINASILCSSEQLATKLYKQSKTGKTHFLKRIPISRRETKKNLLEMAPTFTADIVMKAIKICRKGEALGPDIFHLKHPRPREIEYKTCFRDVKSTSRKANAGGPARLKTVAFTVQLYIADMPRHNYIEETDHTNKIPNITAIYH